MVFNGGVCNNIHLHRISGTTLKTAIILLSYYCNEQSALLVSKTNGRGLVLAGGAKVDE